MSLQDDIFDVQEAIDQLEEPRLSLSLERILNQFNQLERNCEIQETIITNIGKGLSAFDWIRSNYK